MEPTIREQKGVRAAVLQSAEIFEEFLRSVRSAAAPYDENTDIFGFYTLRNLLAAIRNLDPVLPTISKGTRGS